jgi:hypothetical protein
MIDAFDRSEGVVAPARIPMPAPAPGPVQKIKKGHRLNFPGPLMTTLLRFVLVSMLTLFGNISEAREVTIKGDRLTLNVGAMKGNGVRESLIRNDLVSDTGVRDASYQASIRELGTRMTGAKVIVGNHPGGLIFGTIEDVKDIDMLGLPVMIVGRYCISACTLFLWAKHVCVSPKTRFGFHRPGPAPGTPPLTKARIDATVNVISQHFRPALKKWWIMTGSKSRQLKYLTGEELIRIGYRSC